MKYFEKSIVAVSASSLVKAEDFEGARAANQIENEPNKRDKNIGTFNLFRATHFYLP